MQITKRFTWEAAHRLMLHPGKCANLHGHGYVAEVTVEGEMDTNAMVLDFEHFLLLRFWIDAHLDHACILNTDDAELIALCGRSNWKHYEMDCDPTVEAICQDVFDAARRELPESVRVVSVRVHETTTGMAEVRG